MSDRNATVTRIPTTIEDHYVEVTISYSKGGINYATYKPRSRGYYMHVQPIKVGPNYVEFVAFTGIQQCIEEASRFSAKKLDQLVETFGGGSVQEQLVDYVCKKQGITLAEEVAA